MPKRTMYNHVMLDLETYGTRPNSVILAIGAVAFNPSSPKLGPEFYSVINYKSSLTAGLLADLATIEWWSRQGAEA